MFGVFSSCATTVKDKDWQQTSKVVYRHSTPTITPEYYRSFSVTIDQEAAVVDIRNYSSSLLTKRIPLTAGQFKAFVSKLQQAGVTKRKEVDSAASGCESQSLSLYKGDNEYFSAYEACGAGTLKVKDGDLGDLVRELVPDLDTLIEQTLHNDHEE